MIKSIPEIREKVSPIFKQYGISKAFIFGSYASGKETPESDIDFLIHIQKRPFTLIELIQLKQNLEENLEKKVDLVSDDAIIPYFEASIKKNLVQIYG